jgi:hypothetical protein
MSRWVGVALVVRRLGYVQCAAGILSSKAVIGRLQIGGTVSTTKVAGQRWTAVVILLVLGIFSLPVTAFFFDGEGRENWIIPVAVLLMAVLGGIVGSLLPGLAGSDATQQRGALIGAAVGVGMLALGIVVFFLLLNGFDGA